MQGTHNTQATVKKNKVGGLTLPDSKIHYRTIMVKTCAAPMKLDIQIITTAENQFTISQKCQDN
jgi:hypothetical protein